MPAPPLVVGSYATTTGSKGLIPGLSVGEWVRKVLTKSTAHLTGANFVYDTFVIAQEWPELLPEILAAYSAGRRQ